MAVKILGLNGLTPEGAKSAFSGLDAGSNKIINVVDPTNAQDVATKAYADGLSASNALDGTFRIKNTSDNTKQIAFDASGVATGTTRTVSMPDANVNLGLIASAIQSSEKGAANGVATLGADSKIPSAQLPAIAITDTSVVASQVAMLALTAQTGDVAVRTDLNKSFILAGTDPTVLGDWQELLTPTDTVLSVNGQTGAVSLTTTNISEGTNLYYTTARFDTALGTKSTSDLSEGTNKYFTEARVLASVLAGFVSGADAAVLATDSVLQGFQKLNERSLNLKTKSDFISVTQAVDLDAIETNSNASKVKTDFISVTQAVDLDAIETNSNASKVKTDFISVTQAVDLDAIETNSNASKVKTDFISVTQAVNLDTMESDIAQLQSDVQASYEAGVAGEAMALNEIWYVRRAKNGETAGRYYKAQANSSINANVVGVVAVGGTSIAIGDPIRVYKLGTVALGSADTAFVAADLSTQIYLHQSTAGKMTLAPTSAAGDILKEIGYVATVGSVEYVNGLKITA